MDLVFCQGMRMSRLFPKTSKFPFKVQTLIYKHPEVTIYRQLQSLDKHPNDYNQRSNLNILHNHGGLLQQSILTNRINLIHYSTSQKSGPCENKDCYTPSTKDKPTLFQRMKQMTKDYWHILIPVHLVTSAGWMGIFYLAAKNGVNIVGMLESLSLSERFLDMLRGSTAHWAVAYALYKIFTPVRYTITLGGTTMAIRLLNRWGYITIRGKSSSKLVPNILCGTVLEVRRRT